MADRRDGACEGSSFFASSLWGVNTSGLKIISVAAGDSGGTVEIDGSGSFLNYTPAAGFEGIETFTYTIETADGLTDTATVSVRVGPITAGSPLKASSGLVPFGEIPPAERTGATTSTAEVALPVVAVDRLPVARSVATLPGRQAVFATTHAARPQATDLLNLSLGACSGRPRPRWTPRPTRSLRSWQLRARTAATTI